MNMQYPETFNLSLKVFNLFFVSQIAYSWEVLIIRASHNASESPTLVNFPDVLFLSGEFWALLMFGMISVVICLTFVAYLSFEICRLPQKILLSPEAAHHVRFIQFVIEDFNFQTYYWNLPMKVWSCFWQLYQSLSRISSHRCTRTCSFLAHGLDRMGDSGP